MSFLKKGLENCKITFYCKTEIDIEIFFQIQFGFFLEQDMIAFFSVIKYLLSLVCFLC